MTSEVLPDAAPDSGPHALLDVLMGRLCQRPVTAAELAALIATIETLAQAQVRQGAAAAVIAERLAAALGRPDLEMRARLVHADALHRGGDTTESGRLVRQVQAWAAENGDDYLLAHSHSVLSALQ